MNKKIAVIGGDMRQIYLSNMLANKYQVSIFGNDHEELIGNVSREKTLEEVLQNSEIVICPIPFSKDGEHIFVANSKEKILYKDLFSLLTKEQKILSGPYKEEVLECANDNNIHLIDIVSTYEFSILNSIPTAEGILSMMIESLGITLSGSRCLVLGYGRCGMAIANLTKKMNMNVYVASVNDEELIMAKIRDYNTLKIHENKLLYVDYLNEEFLDDSNFFINLERFNYVINTIPARLININLTKKIDDYIFIDIANIYNDDKNRFINARGIPGKYSPKTAAKIISAIVEKHI